MTTTIKPLDKLYTDLLATVNYHVDEQGFITKSVPGGEDSKTPVIIGGKTLVFPNDIQLTAPDWSKRYGFHPMRENFSSGFSPVFEDYRRRMMFTIGFRASYLMLCIADMATKDGAYQKSLPPEVAEFLSYVKDGDPKFRDLLFNIMSADPMVHKSEMEFVRINVQKGRKIDGVQRKRSAHVTFPVLEKVLSHNKDNKVTEIAGVKGIRAIDREMIRSLHKLVFPLAETPEAYTVYSDSLQAPSMDCLLRCVSPMIERINEITAAMIGHVPGMADAIISYNWKELTTNMDAYASVFNSIPMLNGNDGAGRVVDPVRTPPAIQLHTNEQAQAVQAAIPTNGRTVTVVQPQVTMDVAQPLHLQPLPQIQTTPPLPAATHIQPNPQQPFHLDQTTVQHQPVTAAFRLDGPRGGQLTPTTTDTAQSAPMVAKYAPTSPQDITTNAAPLFAATSQQVPVAQVHQNIGGVVNNGFPVQMPTQAGGIQMPQGQPTVTQTAAGPIYVWPNGTVLNHNQYLQLQAQQQQIAGLQGLTALGTNPVMQQLLAMNPNNALVAAAVTLNGGGFSPNGVPTVAMTGQGAGFTGFQTPNARANGTPYTPLTTVHQTIPGYGSF